MRKVRRPMGAGAGRRVAMAVFLASTTALPALAAETSQLEAQMQKLQQELADQRALIEKQETQLQAQQREIDALKDTIGFDLAAIRGAGVPAGTSTAGVPAGTVTSGATAVMAQNDAPLPDAPVGEAPEQPDPIERAEVRAIPPDQGVLTPAGTLIFDPSLEYTRSSANRLVFRGIELVPGIQIGLIEATDVDRDTVVGTAAARYGLTNRIELEARIPYIYRNDRIEVVQQRDEGIVRNIHLEGDGIGDIEGSIRYQINRANPLKPIWIGTLRVKSNTGRGPFEIPFDEFGVATGLATGSGFWAVEPAFGFLLPSDPVVIFGRVNYLWHIARDIDEVIGDVLIGRVDPGDSIGANIGFGFALNPRFSYSLGYRHSYIFPTESEIGDTIQRSNKLHVGVLGFGMSYRVTERNTLNLGFEFGVTSDAPDVSITLRSPLELLSRGN